MRHRTLIGLAAASLVAAAGSANATSIGHFAPAGAAGGVLDGYVGTGISNDNMVLGGSGGVSLGLKSHNRFAGDWGPATLDGDRGVYTVQPGLGPGDPASSPTMWSYLYAVDFNGVDAADYGIRVKLDFDAADGDVAAGDWYVIEFEGGTDLTQGDSQSMGFNWYDPANPALPTGFVLEGATVPWPTGANATFSGTDNYQDIDVNAAGRYDVEVEVYVLSGANAGEIVAASAMSVVVVPLPPAAWAGLAGLAGAAVMRRRFRG